MSTTVKNPTRRADGAWYKYCAFCGETFTPLGLPRHWNFCKKKPKSNV